MSKKPDVSHIAEALRPLAVPIAELTADPRNAMLHPEENLRAIMASLARFGQREPLVANRRNGQVESGNGRLEAATRLGWTHVAVVWVEDDPASERGYKLADNRTAELAEWDDDKLAILLEEVRESEPELFEACSLDGLFMEAFLENEEPGEAAGGDEPVPEIFKAIVACRDQADQTAFVEQLEREGFKCRALVL